VIAGMCPAPDSIDDLDMLCAGGMPIPLPTVVANNFGNRISLRRPPGPVGARNGAHSR